MSYRDVRALVLGATGFIGRQVVDALAAQGAEVVASGKDAEALAAVAAPSGTEFIVCDVMHPHDVAKLLETVQPTITFNLAGYGVHPAERDPAIARRINAELPAQLSGLLSARAGSAWSGQVLVHTGSAAEYGTASGDLRETTACTPTTLYGQTKLAGTIAIQHHGSRTGFRAITARLFTVYGPGEHAGRLLPAVIEAARRQAPLPLTEGRQQRDFTFVGDVVDGLLRLGAARTVAGEVVNLATGQLHSVRNFVERAADVLGLERTLLQFGALPTRTEEMSHDPVSITRLRELTAWAPSTSIEEGVRKTVGR